jgi:hypothetical protein
MVSGRWVTGGLMAAAVAVAGCRAVPTAVTSHAPPELRPPPAPTELPPTLPGSLEPDLATLPRTDPLADPVPSGTPAGVTFRGLTEAQCRELAALHAPLAEAIEPPADPASCSAAELLAWEVRTHAADAARNKAAYDALDRYFRLAEGEAKGQILRDAVPLLDAIRADSTAARGQGLRLPVEPADLDRQRATLVGLVGQADLGVAVLNIELKRQIGHPARGSDRLWPVGPFPVSAAPVDVDAGVRTALERRGDLRMLRAAYLRLTPETLAEVRELLRDRMLEMVPDPLAGFPLIKKVAARRAPPRPSPDLDAAERAELDVRRQQLYDLIAAKEREAADDVRAAAAAVTASVHQIALARWQAETLAAKADEAKPRGPLVERPARLEAVRARADVAAAVYAYHQARVRLLAAQGVLPDPGP